MTLTLLRDDTVIFSTAMPFLWHPFLYHYGRNVQVPDEGPFSVHVRIEPPSFMRHDPVNGKRYRQPVEATFHALEFTPGRKPSPSAAPRGHPTPCASPQQDGR